MTANWPDSNEFWRDKRVIVTGGAGFPGSFVVEKLQKRGAAEIIVPRSSQYDLRDINAIRQLFHDVGAKSEIRNPKSRNVSSEVQRGEVVGIPSALLKTGIGHNGAGKSKR